MNKILLVLILFLAGCEGPDVLEKGNPYNLRYADFEAVITVNYVYPSGCNPKYIKEVTVNFTPTRVGAFIIESNAKIEKVVSTAMDSVSSKEFKFGKTPFILVTFSDGKSIERTIIEIK